MKESEQLILFTTVFYHLEWYQQFWVAVEWLVLYGIFKNNIEPANLSYDITHGQTLAYRMSLGPSFQL
jgi:hypothetical protein